MQNNSQIINEIKKYSTYKCPFRAKGAVGGRSLLKIRSTLLPLRVINRAW